MKNTRVISPLLWSSICILLSNFGCAEKPTIDDILSTTISGRILNKKDNSVIVGASISTQPPTTSTVTDEQGRFNIAVPDFNVTAEYTVLAVAEGFVSGQSKVQVYAGRDNPVDVVLELIQPLLELKDESIRFELDEQAEFLALSNIGNALLEWEVQIAEVPWLEVLYDGNLQSAIFTGSTPAGQESLLKLTVDRERATEIKELFSTSIYIRPTSGGAGHEVVIEMVKDLPPTRILGEVLSRQDNSAIVGASVSTQPPTTTIITDAPGGFIIEISGIEVATDYTVIAAATGFATDEVTVQVQVGRANPVVNMHNPTGVLPVPPSALAFGT